MVQQSTKERLVSEAMRLFSEQGYGATSITQIEKAAGLVPGCGARCTTTSSRRRRC